MVAVHMLRLATASVPGPPSHKVWLLCMASTLKSLSGQNSRSSQSMLFSS